MGTTIYSQLNREYVKRFYGQSTLEDYEKRSHGIIVNRAKIPPSFPWGSASIKEGPHKNKCAVDHIHVDLLVDLHILPETNIESIPMLMIVREPIDRFISICNFDTSGKLNPGELIRRLKNGEGDNFFQWHEVRSRYNLNITTIKMTNHKAIIDFFASVGEDISLDKRLNVSPKKYKRSDLTNKQITFLKEYFKKDYELYDAAL